MTSVVTGVPDRYRLLDEIGSAVHTPSGVIRTWRAKDRVLNRDVAVRVHAPGGVPARGWIRRALTAGGLATPALAMVYDAAEGSGDPSVAGGAAYVVNEWIEGRTLAERLAEGPMSEREARTVLRRLAEGVAEAHRVGLAVGGLVPDAVVLRPNGLVGLQIVPAATATIPDDIAALGALLEACLTAPGGNQAPLGGARLPIAQPELAALVRRARSTEPGAGLSSAAAMAALLARPSRPRPPVHIVRTPDESDSGWLRRLRERRDGDDDLAGWIGPDGLLGGREADLPPSPYGPTGDRSDDVRLDDVAPADLFPDDDFPDGAFPADATPDDAAEQRPGRTRRRHRGLVDDADEPRSGHAYDAYVRALDDDDAAGEATGYVSDHSAADERFGAGHPDRNAGRPVRRRLLMLVVVVLAFALVVALAWWFGTKVLSVPSTDQSSTPPPSSVSATTAATGAPPSGSLPAAGAPLGVTFAVLYNPQDSDPENGDDVGLTYDGNPTTAWSTVTYRGSADFAGLKDGVGIVYDLGAEQSLSAVTITSTTPGAIMEVRTGGSPDAALDTWTVAGQATVGATTDVTFDGPVTSRYVLVWVTSLVPRDDGFSADIAEVVVRAAG